MGLWSGLKKGIKGTTSRLYERERKLSKGRREYSQKLDRQLRETKRKAYAQEMKKQVRLKIKKQVKAKFNPSNKGDIDKLLYGGYSAQNGIKKREKSAVEKVLYAKALSKEKKRRLRLKIETQVRESFKTPEKVTKPLKGNGKKDIDKMLYGGGYY